MANETGGAAFPKEQSYHGPDGMTLRDYFAAKALGGMIGSTEFVDAIADVAALEQVSSAQKIAEVAYQTADAMLAERAA